MISLNYPGKDFSSLPTKTPYRSHTCGQLNLEQEGQVVSLAGWVHCKRDHGQLLFVDLRDHYGLTQCVVDCGHDSFKQMETLSLESVISVTGQVVARSASTRNPKLPTGSIELVVSSVTVLSLSDPLPFPVNLETECPEDIRLRHRFLELRRNTLHHHIVLRSHVIDFLRQEMIGRGFLEIQTPILTAPSPEGARDFVVPSRLYPNEVYALPQAPQQFKQLLMASGFDKYFQIAPCFRDEAPRADRSPGEFYQLDFEMSFVTQEEVLTEAEGVLRSLFSAFGPTGCVSEAPFPRISYEEASLTYGTDKPDLRNPLRLYDGTGFLKDMPLPLFQTIVSQGGCIRVLHVPGLAQQTRKFFKEAEDWAKKEHDSGLGYCFLQNSEWKGPLAKFLNENHRKALQLLVEKDRTFQEEDGFFFVCDTIEKAGPFSGRLRTYMAQQLNLISEDVFSFCWVVDFPMYEKDPDTGVIQFSHNPFSMPQGGLEALQSKDPLDIKAYQYDIVCNGIELSSGAIRNHCPNTLIKAFQIAGYTAQDVEQQFGALLRAFRLGVPPHGGSAPGIDRMVMLLAKTETIREVIPFPLSQQARDMLMGAPSPLSLERRKELHLMGK